jgi:hypothetical protein
VKSVWDKRDGMRSVVLDISVRLGRPVLPYRPTDAEYQIEWDRRVAANETRRELAKPDPMWLRSQA